jgi:hypothetical protein
VPLCPCALLPFLHKQRFLAQEKVYCTSKGLFKKKRFLEKAELCYAAIVMVMIAARPLLLRRGQQAKGKIKIKK